MQINLPHFQYMPFAYTLMLCYTRTASHQYVCLLTLAVAYLGKFYIYTTYISQYKCKIFLNKNKISIKITIFALYFWYKLFGFSSY